MAQRMAPPLQADKLRADPRVEKARALLKEALADHSKVLQGVRPPSKERGQVFEKVLKSFAEARGGALYYPYVSSGLGHGPLVELLDGSVKYDFINGIGVHGLGHSHPRLAEAGFDACLEDTVMQGNLQQSEVSLRFMRAIIDGARVQGAKLEHGFLSTSGAMANENALKMCFQKKAPAHRLLAFERCFAGRTLFLSQVTDKQAYREGLPAQVQVDYIPFYEARRGKKSRARALHRLQSFLKRYPGEYAGMIFELIQGEGGYYAGDRDFFRALMTCLKLNSVPIFVDEVQTFGRTDKLFAFQHFGLDEFVDVVSVGKMSQVCATLFTGAMKPKPGLISQTFTGSSASIHAGLAMLDTLNAPGILGSRGRIMRQSAQMVRGFRALEKKYPGKCSGPFGFGGMLAFTVGDGSMALTKAFCSDLFERGVMAFVAGSAPVRVRFLLPLVVEPGHIREAFSIIEASLVATCA